MEECAANLFDFSSPIPFCDNNNKDSPNHQENISFQQINQTSEVEYELIKKTMGKY